MVGESVDCVDIGQVNGCGWCLYRGLGVFGDA